jgi:hypothetical protein
MAKPKYDTVVEAVHFQPDGQIAWVRAYHRRGPIFSDWMIMKRPELVASLKAGKKVFAGRRVEHLGGTFEVADQLHLIQKSGGEAIVAGNGESARDHLPEVPLV